MDVIVKYKESLKSAWGYNDYNDWPIKYNSIMHLFCKEFSEEYLAEIAQIDNAVLMANLRFTMNPARIYRMINPIIYGMKKLKIPHAIQRDKVIELLEMVQVLKSGSIFNEDGRNIILNESQVKAIELTPINQISDSSKLHKIIGLLWAYTESIFFRAHDITKEMHGMYQYGNNHLLIREFLNLSPTDLWSSDFLIPYKKICICTAYNENLELMIDAYNHLFLKKGNFVNDLISYRIFIDEKEVDVDELNKIVEALIHSIRKIKAEIEKMNWRERAQKYAEIVWYRKKPISILAGKQSNVPEQVIKNIYSGEIDEKRLAPLSKREIDFMIRTII